MKRSLLAIGLGVAGTVALSQASPAKTPPKGERLFKQRCAVCHAVTPAAKNAMGPNLAGVVGRKAGSTPFAYSPAMKKVNISWTRPNLDRYISGPVRMVPGTRMMVSVPDAAQRAAIVDYLASKR